MNDNDLKPCPWCGGQLSEGVVLEGETFRWRRVQGCCTDGPEVRIDTLSDDREEAEREAKEQAYEAWNTRATFSPPEGFVLVPISPTEEMIEGFWGKIQHGEHERAAAEDAWRDALAVRPEVSP